MKSMWVAKGGGLRGSTRGPRNVSQGMGHRGALVCPNKSVTENRASQGPSVPQKRPCGLCPSVMLCHGFVDCVLSPDFFPSATHSSQPQNGN